MGLKLRELKRRIEMEGMGKTCRHLRSALMEGVIGADDVSIRDLAEAFVRTKDGSPCGREWIQSMDQHSNGPVALLMESAGAVDTSLFSNLTSQLIFAATMEGYESPPLLHSQLSTTRSTRLKKEIIPGTTGITEDMEDDVAEGMPYQAVGFGEDYRETPETKKKGRLIYVTKEAIVHDQTSMILETARGIGELIAIRKEKMWARVLLGLVNNFKWLGTTYNTYQTSTPWINVKSSNGLVVSTGWQQIDASEQLFDNMRHPFTNEAISVVPTDIVHMPARTHQFRQVIGATQLQSRGATSAVHGVTVSENSVNPYKLYPSRYAYTELVAAGESTSNAADWWIHGDIKKLIEWIENWPMQVAQLPTNSILEFTQDIAMGFRPSTKGVFAIKNPRAAVKNYQATSL